MKKSLVVIPAVIILAILGASLVSANGGPHGDYTATTDSCAGCHRTHTATGAKLLVSNSTYNLCMSCHGSSGAGANTNVDDGEFLETGVALLGGGFSFYAHEPTTSAHDMTGDENTNVAWGNDGVRGIGAAIDDPFSCASCHDPHGSGNYRILNERVNGIDISIDLFDEAGKNYHTEQWGSGTSELCAACHSAYHETDSGVGSETADQDFEGGFTHRVDMFYGYDDNVNPETVGFTDPYDNTINVRVPLAESGTNDLVVCMTCHLPHGSSAGMQGIADGGALPGETSASDSALLRLDNRAVCQACHQK